MTDTPTPVADGLVERWEPTLEYIGTGEYVPDMVKVRDGDYVTFEAYKAQAREIAEQAKVIYAQEGRIGELQSDQEFTNSELAAAQRDAYERAANVCEAFALEIGDKAYLTSSKRCAVAIRELARNAKEGEC